MNRPPEREGWHPRPKRQAHSYSLAHCGSLTCGLHIIALDEKDEPICEIVMSPEQTARLIEWAINLLESKHG